MTSRLPTQQNISTSDQKNVDDATDESPRCQLSDGRVASEPFEAYVSRWVSSAGPLSRRLFKPESLRGEILTVIGPTLVYLLNEHRLEGRLRGDSPEARYQYFEATAQDSILPEINSRFPLVLGRLRSRLEALEALCLMVLQRFQDDRRDLLQSSIIDSDEAELLQIEPVGDVHAGSATCRLTCTDGTILYYKPRSASGELIVQAVSDILCDGSGVPRSRVTPRILDRPQFSWAEHVESAALPSAGSAEGYYRQAGHLLLIAYVLRLTDLHYENILPGPDTPCIIDAETVFTTPLRRPTFPTFSAAAVNETVMSSVNGSGMLPVGTGSRLHGGDISAFSPGEWKSETRVLINPGRDDLKFEKRVQERRDTSHLPYYNDESGQARILQPAQNVEAIVEGFTASYQTLVRVLPEIKATLSERGPSVECRLLARRTNDYSTFVNHLWSVSNLTRQDALYERLRASATGISEGVVDSEIAQIRNGDIPMFRCLAGSTEIKDPSGRIVGSIDVPPLQTTIGQLSKLGDADLALQQRMTRFAFEGEQTLSLINPQC